MCTSSRIWITDRLPSLPSRQTLPRLLSFSRLTLHRSVVFLSPLDIAGCWRCSAKRTLLRPKMGCHLFAIWSFPLSNAKEAGCLAEAMRTRLSSTVCQSTLGRHTLRVLSGRTLPRGRTPHPAAGHFRGCPALASPVSAALRRDAATTCSFSISPATLSRASATGFLRRPPRVRSGNGTVSKPSSAFLGL